MLQVEWLVDMKLTLILFLLFQFQICFSQLQVPSFFGDHMILQQNETVKFWGKDIEGTKIKIISSWGNQTKTTTNKLGFWSTKLKTPSAGGPYKITIIGSNVINIEDVLIGEVWISSGQSNMEMSLSGSSDGSFVENGLNEIVNSQNNNIRFFNVERNPSPKPINNLRGKWEISNPNNSGKFSAVSYFFAKKINNVLNVPVGIIVSSWGGSSGEAWTSDSALKKINTESNVSISQNLHQVPSMLYNGMIHPLIGYNIRGFLWYQGESNRTRPFEYVNLISNMVSDWRSKWDIGKLPFYMAQISPFEYKEVNSAFLREAQLKITKIVPNSELIVTLDLGECHNIHPSKKKEVGERFAFTALAKNYGYSKISYKSAEPIEVNFDSKSAIITFSDKIHLVENEVFQNNFQLEGIDNKFYNAKVVILDKYKPIQKLVVYSDKIINPVSVRYGFHNCVKPTLFTVNGLPISSFRFSKEK